MVVPEVVVDQLEPVEIQEQDRGELTPARGALEGLLEPVHEEHPVRQPRELVVEGALHQLRLERLVPADVPGVEDDPPHPRLVEQVGSLDLEPAPRAVAVLPAELDRPGHAALLEQLSVEGLRALSIAFVNERPASRAHQPVRLVREDRLDSGADVPDGAVRLQHEDHVGGVLHQRPEALLARAKPLLVGREAPVRAAETDHPEAQPAHRRPAQNREGHDRPGQGAVGPLEHSGIHAGGKAGGLAHLFQSGSRRDRARLIETPREKQREGLVHGGLLHLDGGDHPGRRVRSRVQTEDPIERADASLVARERFEVEGELLPRLPQPRDQLLAPARLEDRLALDDVLLPDPLLHLGHEKEGAAVRRRLLHEEDAAGRREDRDGERR